MKKIKNPHDAILKVSMGDMRVAKDFINHYLPAELLQLMNLDTLAIQNGSFTDSQLKNSQTDILYRVQTREEKSASLYIYVLLEAQSTPDKWMTFRLLKYITRILDQHQRQHTKDDYLPLVFPLVFYTGRTPYRYSMHFEDLFREPADTVRTSLFGPYRRIDLLELSDEELTTHQWSGYLEMAMKYVKLQQSAALADNLANCLQYLYQQPHTDMYIAGVLEYLIEKGDISHFEKFLEKIEQYLSPEIQENTMTTAERLRQEGRQEGREEGEQQKAAMIACRLEKDGFPIDYILKVTGITWEELKCLIAKTKEKTT